MDADAVHLIFDFSSAEIPISEVESVHVAHGIRWSGVRIRHANVSSLVAGLPPMDARALAYAVEAARDDWWRHALAGPIGALRSVHERLAELSAPSKYLTTEAFRDLEADARTAAGGLPARWPEVLSDARTIQIVRHVLAFLESPGDSRAKANEAFVANELLRSRDLFDRVETWPLKDDQRRAVVRDEHRNLVVAPAGSGKTSVLVAKVAWLVHRMRREPAELLLLAFARDARNEMEERIRTRLGTATVQGLRVRTFHSLGLEIIGEAEGKKPALSPAAESDRALFDLLKGVVASLFSDSVLSSILVEWFQSRSAPYKSEHEFANWGEYHDYIRKFGNLSLRGETVRSFEECEIANFLYLHGVAYAYEAPYKHDLATPDKRQYKPDFHLPDHGIYIEHFGINAAGNTAPFVDREKYLQEREWKRGVHAEHNTVLIETFSHERQAGLLIPNLTRKLAAYGVTLSRIPDDETFSILQQQGRIDPFTRLVATFLKHFKGSRLSFSEVAERAAASRHGARAHAFLALFRPIFDAYQEELARSSEIDFDDMINRATDLVEAGRYRSPFRYILVDEFQDISAARARLLKALLKASPSYQLFAVGDDWQSIYRFGGADIALMREFGAHFGTSERVYLGTTFRCCDRISAVATDFVLRNPEQLRKTVHATSKASRKAVHVGLPGEGGLPLLKEALDRIAEDSRQHEGTSDVLLLGRYRHLRPPHMGSLQRQYPGLRFSWMTVHGSKGLEADYVVVLGMCSGKYGFPSEIADDPLLDLVLATPEAYPNAEERRLLYVAITRAKRQVFLLAEGGPPSAFVRELTDGGYDVARFGRPPEEDVPCPRCCLGRLVRRENSRNGSIFYGCSNFPLCEHMSRACPKCRTGIPVRSGRTYLCRDCGGTVEACPVCGGWLDTKMGRFGRFLGCSNWPDCDYTRNLHSPRNEHEGFDRRGGA